MNSLWVDINLVFRDRKVAKIEKKIAKITRKRQDLRKEGMRLTHQHERLLGDSLTARHSADN